MRRQGMRRASAAVVIGAVVGALVGGCGAGPSQTNSAVIVGSQAVSVREVQSSLDGTLARTTVIEKLAQQGIGAPEIARDIVTQSVLHELSEYAAAAAGIVVTPADVDAELAMRGGAELLEQRSPFPLPVVRGRIADDLIAERLAAKQINTLEVTADILGVASRADAEKAARTFAAGGPAAQALLAQNPQTSRRGIPYRASANPDVAASAVFGTPVGGAGYFPTDPQLGSWIVFRVVDRKRDAAPVAASADAAASIGKAGLEAIGTRLLQPVADQLGVRVNPRYGVWDPVSMRVLAPDQVAGAVLPPAAG